MTAAELAGLALLHGRIREALLLAELADAENAAASGQCPGVAIWSPVTDDGGHG